MTFAIPNMTRLIKPILFTLCLLLVCAQTQMTAAAAIVPTPGGLVITELLPASQQSASQEFIVIANNSDEAINVTNMCLVYSSASDATSTTLACLAPPNIQTQLYLRPRAHLVFVSNEFAQYYQSTQPHATFNAGLAGSGGHIKLQAADKSNLDVVGWGSASQPETQAIAAPPTGKMLQRKTVEQGFIDTHNNLNDFQSVAMAVPATANDALYEEIVEVIPINLPELLITELLPDVAGADSGKEFIELYNASDTSISLQGLRLQLGPAFTKSFSLPEATIAPRSYFVLLDTESGLVMPNTSGSVRIVDAEDRIIAQTDVYTDLGEDVAWAFANGVWQATYHVTPGTDNSIVPKKPCEPGQQRSAETDRCINPTSPTAILPVACKPDQERNPDTGRCRKIILPLVATACKAGQTRNPDTSRCKNVASSTQIKLCPAGQERSAETGRCRKAASKVNNNQNVKDVASELLKNNMSWWMAGMGAVGSVGYAAYEWRRDILNRLGRLRTKLFS